MKDIFVPLLIIAAFSFSAMAKSLELKKNNRSIFIEENKQWKLAKDLFGMPFIYFSPQENGQRSNISFTDTGAEFKLDIKALASNQNDYQKNKKIWAQKVGALPLGFLPYEVKINDHGHRTHKIGLSYVHENKTYHERSYYIECRGKIYFSKSLRLSENQHHEKDFNDLIHSFDCGGI